MKAGELYARMAELAGRGAPFVLVTVIEVKGSGPRGTGAKMLVLGDGTTVETIGGGVLEHEAVVEAGACLAAGRAYSRTYQLRAEGDHALGGLCGGEMTVFFEPHVPARTLLVIGAGHIGQKLCALASMLDQRVVVLDSRADMVTRERFPEAGELICDDPALAADLCEIGERTSVVIVTHSAEHDEKALRAVIGSPAAYIGMIGSRRKVAMMRAAFIESSRATAEEFDRVHAPIGLDIGAVTVPEIAASIAAQLVAARRKGSAAARAGGMKR